MFVYIEVENGFVLQRKFTAIVHMKEGYENVKLYLRKSVIQIILADSEYKQAVPHVAAFSASRTFDK